MKRLLRVLAVYLSLMSATLVFDAFASNLPSSGLVSVAFAQTVPDGLSRLEQKANDLQALIQKILVVFTGLGIAFCGFRFVTGDPHAWKYTLTVIVGATIVFTSAELMQWLQR